MEFTLEQIAQLLNGTVEGDASLKINRLSKIQEASEGSIAFLSNLKYESFIYDTAASGVIVSNDFKPKNKLKTALIKVADPYAGFTALLEEYHRLITFQKSGVEEPSIIGEGSTTGENIYRGAFSYIGKNTIIGNNVKIYAHCFIGDNVVIKDNTIIHAGAKIYEGTQIGNNCVIHAGAVIGSDGFGFAPQNDGTYKAIPQMGNVILHDYVNVGANTTIDCATIKGDSTLIKEGAKIDNLIMIAHNVEIGKHTVIAGQVGISGSTKIGDHNVLAGQVGIAGHLEIADRTTIGAQSGVMKSVKEEGKVIFGSPTLDHRQFLKIYAVFKKLPDLDARLKELEQKVLNLPTV